MLHKTLALILCGGFLTSYGTYRFVVRLDAGNQSYLRTCQTMERAVSGFRCRRSTIPFCAEELNQSSMPKSIERRSIDASKDAWPLALPLHRNPSDADSSSFARRKKKLAYCCVLRETGALGWQSEAKVSSTGHHRRQVMPAGGASEVSAFATLDASAAPGSNRQVKPGCYHWEIFSIFVIDVDAIFKFDADVNNTVLYLMEKIVMLAYR